MDLAGKAFIKANRKELVEVRRLLNMKLLNQHASDIEHHTPPASFPYWTAKFAITYTYPPGTRKAGQKAYAAITVFFYDNGTPYLL